MVLTSTLSINGYSFSTFGLFILFGYVLGLFVTWRESKKDGFDEERVFDLYILSTLLSILMSRVFFAISLGIGPADVIAHTVHFWTPGLNVYGSFFGFLLPVFILVRRLRWSVFRILDILSLAWLLGAGSTFLGYVALQKDISFLFVFALYAASFAFLSVVRNPVTLGSRGKFSLKSGYVFSITLFLNALLGGIFWHREDGLIFYGVLFTMGLVNLFFRTKRDMPASNLVEKFKKDLLKRKSDLEKQERLLDESDAFLQEGRDTDNSEPMDEALLEDAQKELTDIKKSSLGVMLAQVRRALARMKIGKYGICEECGDPIEEGRLKIYPEATTCVSCLNKKGK